MGLLDEAIREHLELKRAHGAGEDEVRRKEQEALGPARREAAPAQEAEAAEHPDAAMPAPAPEQAPPPVPAPVVEPEPVVEEVAAPDASSLAPEAEVGAPEAAPAVDPAAPEPDSSEWAAIDEPFADPPPAPQPEAPEPEAPAVEGDRPSSGNTPTQGFDALSEEGEGSEDVLEETPEFLQDTPEHDKLWFEQKPPRDFDFDDK